MTSVTVNGHTYTDDDNATTGLANGGHRTRLVPMLADTVVVVGQAAASAAAAATSESNAAASAASAAAIAGAFVGTSSTSWTPAIGAQVFVTQAGEQYSPGIFVTIVSAANGANNGYGQVLSYSGTNLNVDVQVVSGSGAHTDWNISIAGPRGPMGPSGVPQWVTKTATYTAVANDALMCNTSGGAFTINLPATPTANDVVRLADYAGAFATYNLTVGRNGNKIMGLAEDMTISTNNASIVLTYIDATQGWRIV